MAIEKTINLNVNSKDAVKGIEQVNSGLVGLGDATANVEKGTSAASKGFKGLGTAIKATGIGLVVAALAKLGEVFMQNQKVADVFNTTFEAVSIVFNDFVNFIVSNTGGVIKFFDAIFKNPLESLKSFAKAFKENIQERFDSYLDTLGYLASAVKKVFSGDFAGALDDVKNAGKESLDVLTGVNDSFDKGKDFVEKSTEAIKNYATETVNAAKSNTELAKQSELAMVLNQGLIESYDRQAELLRQTRDDESKSIEERIKANENLAKVLDDQEKAMLSNAAISVKRAEVELAKNKESIELQKAYQEALNEQAGIEAQITGFRSEQQTNTNSLLREQKEIAQELALIGKDEREIERQELLNNYEAKKELINREVTDKIEKDALLLEAEGTYREQLNELNKSYSDASVDIAKKESEAKQKALNGYASALSDISGVLGQETEAGKGIAIASSLVNTYAAISGQLKAFSGVPIPGYAIAQAIATGVTGFAQVKKIASVKIPNSGGGGGSTGSPPSGGSAPTPPSFNVVGSSETSVLADTVASQTNEPVQAYVVSNDVTTAQSLQNNIVEGATI